MKKEIFEYQKRWIDKIVNFMRENNILDTSSLEKIIIETYQSKNKIGMNFIYKDINDFYDDFSINDKNKINIILEKEFGYNLEKDKIKDMNKIFKILNKNKISDDKELLVVEKNINNIYYSSFINKLKLLIKEYKYDK